MKYTHLSILLTTNIFSFKVCIIMTINFENRKDKVKIDEDKQGKTD